MGPFSFLTRAIGRAEGAFRTLAARETAILGPGSRLTKTGVVDNIVGRKDAIAVGANSIIAGQLLTFGHAGSIRIGDWCFVGEGSRIWSAAEVVIGNRVLISHNVDIHDTNSHPLDAAARFEQTKYLVTRGHPRENPGIKSTPIWIGDDVWIGFGATILRGVRIGSRSIIGARAIVRSDVADGSVIKADDADSATSVR